MKSDEQRSYGTREKQKVTKALERTMRISQQNQGTYLEMTVERSSFHDCLSYSDKWENETRDDWNEEKGMLGFIGTGFD
jgi:hypothetical protein